ncbi:MAG: ATP-grasp domain-containing protein [Nanoarchaeota archaeon]|nr:ATP-grasp domain-containing protein [Nanoarchaeota archaeon]
MKQTVLITSIGATGSQGLIKSVDRSMFRIIGCDANPNNGFSNQVDSFKSVPFASDSSYAKTVFNLAKEERTNLIIPIMDEEIEALQKSYSLFKNTNLKILCLNRPISLIRNKMKAIEFLSEYGLDTPDVYTKSIPTYPAIIKPMIGTGSKNVNILENEEDFNYFKAKYKNPFLIQKYYSGIEISVDSFSDIFGNSVAIVLRKRLDIRNGLCKRSATFKDRNLISLVRLFLSKAKISGPCNLQGIIIADKVVFFDINCRFGGTYIVSIKAGIPINEYILDYIQNRGSNEMKDYKTIEMIRNWNESFYESK